MNSFFKIIYIYDKKIQVEPFHNLINKFRLDSNHNIKIYIIGEGQVLLTVMN